MSTSYSYKETFSTGSSAAPLVVSGFSSGSSSQQVGQSFSSSNGGFSQVSSAQFGSSGSVGTVSQIAQDLLQFQSANGQSSGSSSFNAGGASISGSGALISGGGSSSFNAGGASISGSGASFSAGGASVNGGSVAIQSSSSSFNASSSQSGSGVFLSEIEQAILRSTVPVEVSETENLTVNFKGQQESGIWANRQEVINWKGVIPITEYIINEDLNPEVITKRSEQQLVYIQELAIRYLRPPTPPAPGEILITQELNTLTPPAPPLVIRQVAARAETPEPLVVREAPPAPPAAVGRKVITISGKRIPPAPRKVVIERLAPLPSKPQSVLVERWLPYSQVKRRVIFQRSNQAEAVVVKPRNVIVQWEAPQVVIKKEFKYLGVIRANPVEYVQRYGATLKVSRELPDFVLDIKTPEGLVLAADYQYNSVHELEGDVKALGFVDLENEGLSEYRTLLAKLGITYVGAAGVINAASQYQSVGGSFSASASSGSASFGASASSGSASFGASASSGSASFGASASSGSASFNSASFGNSVAIGGGSASFSSSSQSSASGAIISEIFSSIDTNADGQISVQEAARVFNILNQRLNRQYGEAESRVFFQALDINRDGQLSLEEFRVAFAKTF